MVRKLRVEYEGAIYHVVIRGVERRKVFSDDADRERFLDRLSKYAVEMEGGGREAVAIAGTDRGVARVCCASTAA
ncbi:MAG: hypothetical protein WCI03_10205 [bacterium]|jgi:hypothetical protein